MLSVFRNIIIDNLGALLTVNPLHPVDRLTEEITSRKTGELWQREQESSLLLWVDVSIVNCLQLTTSSRRQDGGAYCEAALGGKCMASKGKLVLYAFAV